MKVTIKIGDGEVTYAVKQTRAPRSYDGFGTFTLQDGLADNSRLVMVRKEHLTWQEGRNASGLGTFLYDPEYATQQDVEEALWKLLTNALSVPARLMPPTASSTEADILNIAGDIGWGNLMALIARLMPKSPQP
jgi:hypothetical protein